MGASRVYPGGVPYSRVRAMSNNPQEKRAKPRTWCFNFQKRFAPKVASGQKRQTIRARRKDGRMPRRGDHIKLYTGLRTRDVELLCEGTITECFSVTMDTEPYPIV